MSDFTIGVDFGTQSVRAIVVRCSDGTTISESTFAYPHGVLRIVRFRMVLPCPARTGRWQIRTIT